MNRFVVSMAFVTGVAISCAKAADVDPSPSGGATGGTLGDGGGLGGASAGASGGGQAGGAGQNPCASVPCNTPPANECAGSDLKVYAAVGTCDAGVCSYGSTLQTCSGGCSAGSCTGDPCAGVSCNNAPAPTCLDANTLEVSQAPGTCAAGTCNYTKNQIDCPNGCNAGQCEGDPCLGVTCNEAAANYCSDATHLTVRDLPGTCNPSSGQCSYTTHQEYCAFGCANGACTGDPCVGVVCPPKANYCADANTLVQYAAGQCVNGLPCTYGSTNVPCPNGCINGQCVACTTNANCGAGQWCSANVCQPCNNDQHCGTSCVACGGTTPKCNGTSCVECVTSADCSSGQVCGLANTCTTPVGCTPPATACTTAGNQDGGCSNSYRIPRTTAGSGSGFTVNNTYGLCNRANNFTGGCAGTGSDAEYRIFMRQGETVDVALTRGSSTCVIGWSGTISLKIYQAGACSTDCSSCPLTCNTLAYCVQNNNQTTSFVAPSDGWYTIVVDSQGPVEDKGGVFYLNVKLTCAGGNCAC